MPPRKLNKKEWAMYIELQKRNKEMKQKLAKKQNSLGDMLKKHFLGAMGVGVVAGILMFLFFGWKILLETILSWAIGITVVTAFISTISSRKK